MNTKQTLDLLRDYESRNVLFTELDGSWPIVWQRAKGVHVWDAEGAKYLDLTAAFGVATAGHANPAVVHAGQMQMATLLHAMGDVHPHALKAQLARELSRLTFERWHHQTGKVIFNNSGFEAVEAALKTAILATGQRGVIAFEGAYHGLGYGALNATHREHFRGPFRSQLREFGKFLPFPKTDAELRLLAAAASKLFSREKIGAIIVEPIQARGGINIPPAGFLRLLRNLCDRHGALLILDEIYTGFGRTGKWLACEHSGVVPDLICLGKALTGGFPLSACVGRADLMDAAWPASQGVQSTPARISAIPLVAQWHWRRSQRSSDSNCANAARSLASGCSRCFPSSILHPPSSCAPVGLDSWQDWNYSILTQHPPPQNPCRSSKLCCIAATSCCRKANTETSSVSRRR